MGSHEGHMVGGCGGGRREGRVGMYGGGGKWRVVEGESGRLNGTKSINCKVVGGMEVRVGRGGRGGILDFNRKNLGTAV